MFVSGRYSAATERRVGMWLTNGKESKAKNEALDCVWQQSLAETDGEDVDEPYNRWLQRALAQDANDSKNVADVARTPRFTQAPRRTLLRVWQSVAAVLALAVVSMAWLLTDHDSTENYPVRMVQAFCPAGQTRDIILPDGSKAVLNGASTITYLERFTKDERNVLLAGEASFKVAKDAARPFTVSTGDVDVTALGTEFNVKAYSDSPTVAATLVEGVVNVVYGKDPETLASAGETILSPSQQLLFDRQGGVAKVKDVNLNDITAWQRGELVFDNMTLYEILHELENRFTHRFVYNMGMLPTDRYTFRFKKGMNLVEVMKIVEDVTGVVRCSIDDNTCKICPKS